MTNGSLIYNFNSPMLTFEESGLHGDISFTWMSDDSVLPYIGC